MRHDQELYDPPKGTTQLDYLGWWRFKQLHSGLCVCGHAQWEHFGLREPGCSHAGECRCGRFRRPRDTAA